jgi:hypothetical protein
LFIQIIRNTRGFFEKYKTLSRQDKPAADNKRPEDKVLSHN